MTANYHTHTRWCRHGSGEIEEYIQRAIACGLEELAITEHVPHKGDPDRSRMLYGEFPTYNAELDAMIKKYAGRIRVLKGFECEYYPEQMPWYRRLRDEYGYTVFALGQHAAADHNFDSFLISHPRQLAHYANDVCAALETGFFTYLAHPEVPMHSYARLDHAMLSAMRQIFETCQGLDIPVELNANGVRNRRHYPSFELWRTLAPQYAGLRCMVGADAHHVRDLGDAATAECEAFVREAGLNLLEKLPATKQRGTAV